MKLYISYYGNYMSVVEGMYNHRKNKYIIKNIKFISNDDVELDNSDKYSLLKEGLKLIDFKSKTVILCLNTRDVVIKQNKVVKLSAKDLDGMMANEISEMMYLNNEDYTFSYEVTKEDLEENKLDVITVAILNDDLKIIKEIFKENKLNLECIDTISTAYNRFLQYVEYKNLMLLNIGRYGSLVNIYVEDSLFIYDNIPVKIRNEINYEDSMSLVEEINELMKFYASRNHGKTIDNIVLIGEQGKNEDLLEIFEDKIFTDILPGIENLPGIDCLFDIEKDKKADFDEIEIGKIADALGSMLLDSYKSSYSTMNILMYEDRKNKINKDRLKRLAPALIVGTVVFLIPYIIMSFLTYSVNKDLDLEKSNLDIISKKYEEIEDIEKKIDEFEKKISIYEGLDSRSVDWVKMLTDIEKVIPYTVDLQKVKVYYEEDKKIETEDKQEDKKDDKSEVKEEVKEIQLYDKIPNRMIIDGVTDSSSRVGEFVYNLTHLDYFESVELKKSALNEELGGYSFNIVMKLKEGAALSE